MKPTSKNDDLVLKDFFKKLEELTSNQANCSLEPLLPIFLRLNGQPFTLIDYFPLSPLFNKHLQRKIVVKAGRQLGKSTSFSALSVLRAMSIPGHKIMIITPLKSQASNLSNSYVKPFIRTSPLYHKLVDSSCAQGTLFKDFTNQSRIAFNYSHDDPSRIRSYTNDVLIIDETQDFDIDNIPVILETLNASPWRIQLYTGTPLSFDGTLESLWQESSKCEFVIKCEHCGFWNIPNLAHHIEKMIGPLNIHISEEYPAVVCAKCRKNISPRRTGEWVAEKPDLVTKSFGIHVPQIIMPMHYADYDRWSALLDKQKGLGPTPRYRFVNEVLGESYDVAEALIAEHELRNASVLEKVRPEDFLNVRHMYDYVAMSVDWGGGGLSGDSLTAVSILGLTSDGKIHVRYGLKYKDQTPETESRLLLHMYQLIMPSFLCHDYTGSAGHLREILLRQWGIASSQLVPIYLVGYSPNYLIVPTVSSPRNRTYYKVDKTKLLQIVCACIRSKDILFHKPDGEEIDRPLVYDFLDLVEERTLGRGGKEIYKITRRKGGKDDFALATAIGAVSLWHISKTWPSYAFSNFEDIEGSDPEETEEIN
jgi:hypothetical protein